jgi:hypothetical protein
VAVLKTLAVLIAAFGMAAFESVESRRPKDEDDVALFVGSARPLTAQSAGVPPTAGRRFQKRIQLI